MPILSPDQYAQASVYDLLEAAAMGRIGIDRRWLHAILDRGQEAVPDMLRFGLSDRSGDRLDLDSDLLAMFRHLNAPEALPFYSEYARRQEFEFPEDLMDAFLDLGERAVEPLLALRAEAEDPFNILLTLAALRVRDPRILAALVEELERNPADAAVALAHYGDPAAIPALEKARHDLPPGSDDAAREIDGATEMLGEPESEPGPRVPYDIWAEDEERYPAEADPAFSVLPDEELAEFLASPVAEHRADVLNLLAMTGLEPGYVPRVLEMARTDPDVAVRAEALQALSLSLDEPDVEHALRAVVNDASKPVAERAGALIGLSPRVAEDRGLQDLTLEFLEKPGVRAAALRTMWQSRERRFVPSIPPYLNDPDIAVRREAIAGVGWFGMTAEAGRLPELFDEEGSRESALLAYGLAGPAEVTPSTAERFLDRIDQLAGGLSEDESALVMFAINARLEKQGFEPVFQPEKDEHDCSCGDPDHRHHHDAGPEHEPQEPASVQKTGRNEPCPCGSGKKYKKCCGQ